METEVAGHPAFAETVKNNEENDAVVRVPGVAQPIGVAVELRAIPIRVRDVPVAVLVTQVCEAPPMPPQIARPFPEQSAESYPAS